MRPCCRMLAASSCSLDSSKVLRGLVVDSWMVSRARNWNALLFCMIALLGRAERSGGERTRCPVSAQLRNGFRRVGSALSLLRDCCIGGVLRGGGLAVWLLFGLFL